MQGMPGQKQGSAPLSLSIRLPAMNGRFYPENPDACRALVREYLQRALIYEEPPEKRRLLGGIVPHAGWICSAALAGQTIAAIAASRAGSAPDLVVVFGAVHSAMPIDRAALDSHDVWRVPTGDSIIARQLVLQLAESPSQQFQVDDRFHEMEHAVEVELPLIQGAWPEAKLLPIELPAIESAVEIGIETARLIQSARMDAVYLASSDLTHYGPAYGFTPAGIGSAALDWALANDRRLLAKVTAMQAEEIVPEVRARLNACGGGAIAAMLAACREYGATAGHLLRHTNSYQALADTHPQRSDNAVGYAAVVVG